MCVAVLGGADLLEADVHVKGEGLSGVADGGDAELSTGGSAAGDQLHRVCTGIISDLQHKDKPKHALYKMVLQAPVIQYSDRPHFHLIIRTVQKNVYKYSTLNANKII